MVIIASQLSDINIIIRHLTEMIAELSEERKFRDPDKDWGYGIWATLPAEIDVYTDAGETIGKIVFDEMTVGFEGV